MLFVQQERGDVEEIATRLALLCLRARCQSMLAGFWREQRARAGGRWAAAAAAARGSRAAGAGPAAASALSLSLLSLFPLSENPANSFKRTN